MNPVILATIALFGLGLVAAIILAIAAKVFYVWEDPKIAEVEDALLGANCGGCGYAGCSSAAEAVVKCDAKADVCIAGGYDIALAVSKVMGVEVKEKEPEISISGCKYGIGDADTNYTYNGVKDCNAAMLLYGGTKECSIGCLGLGTCVEICPFNAIIISDQCLPIVNPDLCTGCGTCTQACPKGIINLTSNTKRMTSEYTTDDCTAPCQRTCPAGINIPGYIQAIRAGDFKGAVEIMREKNPMLSVCSHICPAPCELECRRNLVDQPVAINMLKKFVADYEMQNGNHVTVFKAKNTEKKVAVVGGGVQGLTTAYYLARLGHNPEIFEVMPKLGGILRYVISKERLPDKVLDWEIKGLLKIGIQVQTGKCIGKDFTINTLFQNGHDAVVFTSGGMDSRKIIRGVGTRIDQSIPGTFLMLDFLSKASDDKKINIGKRVCIIEGGKSALTTADVCMKLGAEEIKIITNKSELRGFNQKTGVELLVNTDVINMKGKINSLTNIEIQNNKNKSNQLLDVDTLIIGLGRLPELVIVPVGENGVWQTVKAFKGFSTKRKTNLFSTVEPGRISDFTATVKAVGAGRKITAILHNYLMDEEIVPQKNLVAETEVAQNVSSVHEVAPELRNIPTREKNGPGENSCHSNVYSLGFTEQVAIKEASRCLDCGLICYKKTKYRL